MDIIALTITGVLVGVCVVLLIIAERSKRKIKKMVNAWLAEMDEREVRMGDMFAHEFKPERARETHEWLLELGKEEEV